MNARPQRPPRRIPFTTNTWANQAPQYDRPDIPVVFHDGALDAITYWRVPPAEVPVSIHCLLHWTGQPHGPLLTGILNYFPEGSAFGEQPGDYLVLVHPQYRRRGIGRKLVKAGQTTFGINLLTQAYTDEGWALAESILTER